MVRIPATPARAPSRPPARAPWRRAATAGTIATAVALLWAAHPHRAALSSPAGAADRPPATLADAVAAAERSAAAHDIAAPRAIAARFDAGEGVFRVTLLAHSDLVEADVDRPSGRVIAIDRPSPIDQLDPARRALIEDIAQARVDLAGAIAAAAPGGTAVAARATRHAARTVYRVDRLVEHRPDAVLIDPASAKPLPGPAAG